MTFNTSAPAGALAKAFAMAARVSPRATSNIIPILANVRLAARDGKLTIAATNMTAKVEIMLDVPAKGAVTAPADKLAAIAARLTPDKPVAMKVEGGELVVTQGRSRFTLPTLPAEDMALQMTDKADASFHVDAQGFSDALATIEGAAETDGLRSFLNGAYMDLSDRKARLAATDGKRLGVAIFETDAPENAPNVIIPQTVFSIVHALADQSDTLKVAVSNSMFAITSGDVRFETKVMEGNFPDWRRMIKYAGNMDAASPTLVKIKASELQQAVQKIAALGPTTLVLTFGEQVEIEAQTSDTREAKSGAGDILDHEGMDGPGLRIVLTSQVMTWALASLDGAASICLRMTDPLEGVLITDPARPDDVRLVMPLRG